MQELSMTQSEFIQGNPGSKFEKMAIWKNFIFLTQSQTANLHVTLEGQQNKLMPINKFAQVNLQFPNKKNLTVDSNFLYLIGPDSIEYFDL